MRGCREIKINPSVCRRVIFSIPYVGMKASLGLGGAIVWDYGLTLADKKVLDKNTIGYFDPGSLSTISYLTTHGLLPWGYQKPFFKSHKKWN